LSRNVSPGGDPLHVRVEVGDRVRQLVLGPAFEGRPDARIGPQARQDGPEVLEVVDVDDGEVVEQEQLREDFISKQI
jgi:hypothetical protein